VARGEARRAGFGADAHDVWPVPADDGVHGEEGDELERERDGEEEQRAEAPPHEEDELDDDRPDDDPRRVGGAREDLGDRVEPGDAVVGEEAGAGLVPRPHGPEGAGVHERRPDGEEHGDDGDVAGDDDHDGPDGARQAVEAVGDGLGARSGRVYEGVGAGTGGTGGAGAAGGAGGWRLRRRGGCAAEFVPGGAHAHVFPTAWCG
jgi:hypothetical protein